MKLMFLILVIQVYSGKSGRFVFLNDKINIKLNNDIADDDISSYKFKTENNTSQIYFIC